MSGPAFTLAYLLGQRWVFASKRRGAGALPCKKYLQNSGRILCVTALGYNIYGKGAFRWPVLKRGRRIFYTYLRQYIPTWFFRKMLFVFGYAPVWNMLLRACGLLFDKSLFAGMSPAKPRRLARYLHCSWQLTKKWPALFIIVVQHIVKKPRS